MVGNGRDRDRCRHAREWASLRLDGELSELERLLLRRHLGRCEECRAFAASIETASAAIRSTPAEQPSRRLAPEPSEAQPRRRAERRRLVLAGALVAAAAAAGAVIGGFVASDHNPAPQAPTQIVQIEPPTTSTTPTGNV